MRFRTLRPGVRAAIDNECMGLAADLAAQFDADGWPSGACVATMPEGYDGKMTGAVAAKAVTPQRTGGAEITRMCAALGAQWDPDADWYITVGPRGIFGWRKLDARQIMEMLPQIYQMVKVWTGVRFLQWFKASGDPVVARMLETARLANEIFGATHAALDGVAVGAYRIRALEVRLGAWMVDLRAEADANAAEILDLTAEIDALKRKPKSDEITKQISAKESLRSALTTPTRWLDKTGKVADMLRMWRDGVAMTLKMDKLAYNLDQDTKLQYRVQLIAIYQSYLFGDKDVREKQVPPAYDEVGGYIGLSGSELSSMNLGSLITRSFFGDEPFPGPEDIIKGLEVDFKDEKMAFDVVVEWMYAVAERFDGADRRVVLVRDPEIEMLTVLARKYDTERAVANAAALSRGDGFWAAVDSTLVELAPVLNAVARYVRWHDGPGNAMRNALAFPTYPQTSDATHCWAVARFVHTFMPALRALHPERCAEMAKHYAFKDPDVPVPERAVPQPDVTDDDAMDTDAKAVTAADLDALLG